MSTGGCPERCPRLTVCDEELGQCVPLCEPDAFGGLNTSREEAAQIEPGLLTGLTICEGEEDWFRLTFPQAGTIIVLAEGEVVGELDDLDLELWGEPPAQPDPEEPEEPLASSAVAGERRERLEHRTEGPGTFYIRVFFPERSLYRLEVGFGRPCLFDWDCCPDPEDPCHERCDGVRGLCVPTSCAADPPDFECGRDEVCDEGSGRCVPAPCEPDIFGGQNTGMDQAAAIDPGARLAGLTICEAEEEWFSFEAAARDGIRAAIRFDDDFNLRTFDLELRSRQVALVAGLTATDDEEVAYNLSEDGTYYLRVFNATRGSYDLELDLVPGGIHPLLCNDDADCGRDRICSMDDPRECLAETCARPRPTIECPGVYECDQETGRCFCPTADPFEQLNIGPETAVELPPGVHDLSICHVEEDWFTILLAAGQELQAVIEGDAELPLTLHLYDAELMWLACAQGEPGRLELRYLAQAACMVYLIAGNGPPRTPTVYRLTLGIE